MENTSSVPDIYSAVAPKSTSSVHNIGVEKPPFGSRFLTDESEVWSQNAWDHVPPPDDQEKTIAASLSKQRLAPVPDNDKPKYNDKPARHWFDLRLGYFKPDLTQIYRRDNFYKMNSSNFFRNRKWLHNEFPELVESTQPEAGPVTVVEIGCGEPYPPLTRRLVLSKFKGAGNSVFPLLAANKNPDLRICAYDYSNHAVKLVQNNPLYLSPPAGSLQAAVWDLTSPEGLPTGIESGTVDIVILVFVFSALHPDEWGRAIANIHQMLKPGGLVVMRDYGRHDLTQLRFKGGRLLDENFYIRGDKTRVYFFELDELALLFTGHRPLTGQITDRTTEELEEDVVQLSGASSPAQVSRETSQTPLEQLMKEGPSEGPAISSSSSSSSSSAAGTAATKPIIHPNVLKPLADCPAHPLFTIEQLGVDRRLLVNRKRQLKMYRVWMQGKFRKVS
ncbi:hypothetical protein D9615_007360 [Tricholomella constricta]|uniref:Methyltransferase type 12 domain-containing protein n=1 Tax=Tricholomella constricta TaxID=117010 RepID=A0A8H5LX73_9AGAR|nr:hypothetical protein D9615_007360 [Tricholomella constricta]